MVKDVGTNKIGKVFLAQLSGGRNSQVRFLCWRVMLPRPLSPLSLTLSLSLLVFWPCKWLQVLRRPREDGWKRRLVWDLYMMLVVGSATFSTREEGLLCRGGSKWYVCLYVCLYSYEIDFKMLSFQSLMRWLRERNDVSMEGCVWHVYYIQWGIGNMLCVVFIGLARTTHFITDLIAIGIMLKFVQFERLQIAGKFSL